MTPTDLREWKGQPMTSYPFIKIELIYYQTGTTQSPGGQQAGVPATLVRATHGPTLTMAQCGIHRSQHKNKIAALEMLELVLGRKEMETA